MLYNALQFCVQQCKSAISSIQFSSVTQSCPTLCKTMNCSTPGFSDNISWNSLKLMSTDLVMSSNHLNLCCPLFLQHSIFPSIRVLHIKRPKYWTFSIGPSNEYSGLISFRIDQFDVLAVQGTRKTLLQL